MRRCWLFLAVAQIGCAQSHDFSICETDEDLIPVMLFAGEFAARVESVETIAGAYIAPMRTSDLGRTRFTLDEPYLLASSPMMAPEELTPVLAVAGREDFLLDPDTGRYCTADPTTRSDPQPRWFETSHVRLGPDVLATGWQQLDPDVLAESVPSEQRLLVPDEDGLGFTLTTDYRIRTPDCSSDACTSLVRVTRHFLRVVEP